MDSLALKKSSQCLNVDTISQNYLEFDQNVWYLLTTFDLARKLHFYFQIWVDWKNSRTGQSGVCFRDTQLFQGAFLLSTLLRVWCRCRWNVLMQTCMSHVIRAGNFSKRWSVQSRAVKIAPKCSVGEIWIPEVFHFLFYFLCITWKSYQDTFFKGARLPLPCQHAVYLGVPSLC